MPTLYTTAEIDDDILDDDDQYDGWDRLCPEVASMLVPLYARDLSMSREENSANFRRFLDEYFPTDEDDALPGDYLSPALAATLASGAKRVASLEVAS